MKSVDGKVYIDPYDGTEYIKIRDIGYSLFAYLRCDGTVSWCGGCVGEEFGWERVENETLEHKKFKKKIEKAKYIE